MSMRSLIGRQPAPHAEALAVARGKVEALIGDRARLAVKEVVALAHHRLVEEQINVHAVARGLFLPIVRPFDLFATGAAAARAPVAGAVDNATEAAPRADGGVGYAGHG